MGKRNSLKTEEKQKILDLKSSNKTISAISRSIGRDRKTISNFLNSPFNKRKERNDKGKFRAVSKTELRKIKKATKINPTTTSGDIFNDACSNLLPRSTRCRILKSIATVKSPSKKPFLTKRHKILRLEWAQKYLKQDFSYVLFTDETRASLDGPDNWQKSWVLLNEQRPVKYIRQKQGGSIMIWAGIIDNKIIGPFRVPDGVKLTSNTYIEFLRENFLPFFNSIPKEKKENLY